MHNSTSNNLKLTSSSPVIPLIGMPRDTISKILLDVGVPPQEINMRRQQIWHWTYVRGANSLEHATNISKALRARLTEVFSLARPEVIAEQTSKDGTRKWLMRFVQRDSLQQADVETVYIPDDDRGTLCVSSQVGCTLNCSFCHTGTQKMVRNLTPEEILLQIMVAREKLGDYGEGKVGSQDRAITNIVMMGMGEPLYNFDAVKEALLIVADAESLPISKRRITLSTAGVVPMIPRAGAEIGVMLAISLHAVRDDLRNELVPINRKYNISSLLDACRQYPGLSNARRITFEYVLLKDVNDSPADARELVRLLHGIPAKVNLIPFNPWPGTKYECSPWPVIEKFADIVNNAGYASPIRTPRGRDILAACGQLKSDTIRIKKNREEQ